jgi:uroporphyrinogen-III synthase
LSQETVVLTGSAGSFPGLLEALREIPVAVEERPLLQFAPPLDWTPLDTALDRVSSYGAIAITSPRAGDALAERIDARGISWINQTGPEIWAVGPATATALRGLLGSVRMPGRRNAGGKGAGETLARTMIAAGVERPVLFLCGETRRDELPVELRKKGIIVDEVVCYRSVLASESDARAAASCGSLVVVASPSVAGLLARACPPPTRPRLLAVGPTTATAARAAGWSPAAVAEEPTARAVATTIVGLLPRR